MRAPPFCPPDRTLFIRRLPQDLGDCYVSAATRSPFLSLICPLSKARIHPAPIWAFSHPLHNLAPFNISTGTGCTCSRQHSALLWALYYRNPDSAVFWAVTAYKSVCRATWVQILAASSPGCCIYFIATEVRVTSECQF
jgi:hypothetical protein